MQSKPAMDLYKPQMMTIERVTHSEEPPVQGSILYKPNDKKSKQTKEVRLPEVGQTLLLKNIIEDVIAKGNKHEGHNHGR